MPYLPLRIVALPAEADALFGEWLAGIDEALDDPQVDRNDLCREILEDLYGVHADAGAGPAAQLGSGSTRRALTQRVARAQFDPRNVTLEPEFYAETDVEQYARVKPLLWLWEMFDRSPVGENVSLGIAFRRLLARRIFRHCGRNFKAFPFVRLTFGYNLEVGDDVVVHRHVLLDDRGGIQLGDGCSISDFANVYSHTHDVVDGRIVENRRTVLGAGVRVTYHATILAGTRVEPGAMIGAGAMLTRDAEARGIYVGVPARQVAIKNADALAARRPSSPDPLADEEPSTHEDAGDA
jgi:acetyltransferase-like isoleucine patch superfamily enzyme